MNPLDALNRAVELCGSQRELARRLAVRMKDPKISQAHVWKWIQKGQAPAEVCRAIEAEVEGKVTRYKLRPDVYGPRAPRLKA